MLKKVLVEGLEVGLTVNQIKEILVHDSAYTGFPRALNAINAFIAVMDEREKQGIKDEHGPEATPIDWQNIDRYRMGHQNLADLRKIPVGTGPTPRYEAFTPIIEVFLKEHLFAERFARDTLTYLERQVATVGALSNMPGANAQFRSHIRAVVAYEPGSSFVFPEGDVPEAMPSLTGTLEGFPIPRDDFMKLTKIPIVIYYGDYIPQQTDIPGQDNWRVRLAMARLWV